VRSPGRLTIGTTRTVVACLVLAAAAAGLAAGATAADPPLVEVGAGTPDGSQSADATVGSQGDADACLADQHSGVSPSASQDGLVQLNDAACASEQGAAATGETGSGGGGASSASTASTGSSAAASTGAAAGGGLASSAAWVAADAARGIRIARVQYLTQSVATTRKLRVLVTLRDIANRRVRHAIVSLGPVAGAQRTVAGTTATYTNRLGQASLAVAATERMLGRRLLLRITARTPSARAVTIGSVLLPGIAPK
jgi:hypothetical protein